MPVSKISLLTLTVAAAANFSEHLAVGHDGNLAGSGLKMLGVATTDGETGVLLAVDVLGTTEGTAGAAIAAGADVQVGSAGKLITKAAGVKVGVALTAAGADGDKIEVLLTP